MADQLFDGKPVLQFRTGHDRRTFLKWAGLVGVGATFAAGVVPTTAQAAELKADIRAGSRAAKAGNDIDILIPHQANNRIIEATAKHAGAAHAIDQ